MNEELKANGVSYQLEYVKCGKERCKKCKKDGPGHGPYFYAYWREGDKVKKKYIGKQLPKTNDQDQDQDLEELIHDTLVPVLSRELNAEEHAEIAKILRAIAADQAELADKLYYIENQKENGGRPSRPTVTYSKRDDRDVYILAISSSAYDLLGRPRYIKAHIFNEALWLRASRTSGEGSKVMINQAGTIRIAITKLKQQLDEINMTEGTYKVMVSRGIAKVTEPTEP